jgi:prepilin-type N-terminal cleavage/methylation domain-containing protein
MSRPSAGFTLLEMLTAIAVLSLMMVFMFNIAGQSVRAWETGGRRMETAQAGRIGMNLLASELRYAFAGVATNSGTSATAVFSNFATFVATNGLPGETSGGLAAVPGSQSLFFISPVGPHDADGGVPFAEIGYLPMFITKSDGYRSMAGGSYALVRHGFAPGSTNLDYQDFYGREAPDGAWVTTASAEANNRTPIVDNCVRFSLEFASTNGGAGSISWTTNWTSQTNLPLGVLVTMLVLDSKSAAKLSQINGLNVLDAATIDKATNDTPLVQSDVAARILREGTTVLRRFVPLVNSAYTK